MVVTEERTCSFFQKIEPENTENQPILLLLIIIESWTDILAEK